MELKTENMIKEAIQRGLKEENIREVIQTG